MKQAYFERADYPLQQDTGRIISLGIEIHKHLGAGFLEIVYKDAFEYEFQKNGILYQREKEYDVPYKTIILRHKFFADFVVMDTIILEVKARQGGISEEDYARTINYLRVSGCKIGLILNFAKMKLEIKRMIF